MNAVPTLLAVMLTACVLVEPSWVYETDQRTPASTPNKQPNVVRGGAEPNPRSSIPEQIEAGAGEGARSRYEAVLAELKVIGEHQWAGHYHNIRLGGAEVWLAPKSGVVLANWSDQGPQITGVAHGDVRTDEHGMLHIEWAVPPESLLLEQAVLYAPIRWQDRAFLVPATREVEFCNIINSGQSLRALFRFMSRDPQPSRPKTPMKALVPPRVPEPFGKCILDEPLNAKVVDQQTDRLTRDSTRLVLQLDRGRRHGIFKGMYLYAPAPRDSVVRVEITELDDLQSTGTYMADWRVRFHHLPVGANVSSRHPGR